MGDDAIVARIARELGVGRELLSNDKERMLVSGMGLERVAKCFSPAV